MEIINGQIHTMGAQGVIKHGAVRVENGKIAWVGTMKQWQEMRHADSAGSELDGSDQVLDAGGGWVMPGIIEAHCHMGITEEKKGMEGDDCNETVDPVTPWLRAIDAINSMDDLKGLNIRTQENKYHMEFWRNLGAVPMWWEGSSP
jgi:imidazolonepropionase-like amidohydrolase